MAISQCAYEKISQLIDSLDIESYDCLLCVQNLRALIEIAPNLTATERHELDVQLYLVAAEVREK